MTPLALWAAVGLIALVSTTFWAVLARETGIYVTSGLSFATWSWLALAGGDTAMILNSGELVWVRDTVASLQYVCLALAFISLVVFALRLMGAYPSPNQNAAETKTAKTADD